MENSAKEEKRGLRLFGFPVTADFGALFLLAFIVLMQESGGPMGILIGFVAASVAALSILAHELGHAFAVRGFGYGTPEIRFTTFGGVTVWRGRTQPRHHILIALAGPAVSLGTGGLVFGLVYLFGMPGDGFAVASIAIRWFVWINLIWGAFNLLPMYPLDGGQIVRAAFATRMEPLDAVRRSAILSIIVGLLAVGAAIWKGYIFAAVLIGYMGFENWKTLSQLREQSE